MASYHFAVQIIRRSKGQSVLAAAAYRAGERLADTQKNIAHDYRRRSGVVHTELLAPGNAATFLHDRQSLWSHVEATEARRDAQLAREIILALPHELDADQRREMLLNFVREAFVSVGMVADVAIHAPVPEKGDHPHNHHAHVLLTLRQATTAGLRPIKTREWNSDMLLREWRALWALRQNEALARAGASARVDHRTLVAQRGDALRRQDFRAAAELDRIPEIHLGKRVRRADANSAPARLSPRAERNVAILRKNAEHARLRIEMWQRAYVKRLQKPRPAAKKMRTTKPRLAHGYWQDRKLMGAVPKTLTGLLRRLGDGMSAWQIIVRARNERHADFAGRYLKKIEREKHVREQGRARMRSANPC